MHARRPDDVVGAVRLSRVGALQLAVVHHLPPRRHPVVGQVVPGLPPWRCPPVLAGASVRLSRARVRAVCLAIVHPWRTWRLGQLFGQLGRGIGLADGGLVDGGLVGGGLVSGGLVARLAGGESGVVLLVQAVGGGLVRLAAARGSSQGEQMVLCAGGVGRHRHPLPPLLLLCLLLRPCLGRVCFGPCLEPRGLLLPCLLLCPLPCLLLLLRAVCEGPCLLPLWHCLWHCLGHCLRTVGRCDLVCAVRLRGSAASRVHHGMGSIEAGVGLHHERGGRSRAVAEAEAEG